MINLLKNLRLYKIFLLLLVFCLLFGRAYATPTLSVDIDEGRIDKHRIEIIETDFKSATVSEVIEKDFQGLGHFSLNIKKYQGQKISAEEKPDYQEKIRQRIDFVISLKSYEIKNNTSDGLKVEYRIWDIAKQKFLEGKSITINQKNWRIIPHRIADKIYEMGTGDEGYFNTKVLYVSDSKKEKQTKRIALMDLDGYNHQFITSGRYDSLNPRVSSDGSKILYMSYSQTQPKVFMLDMNTPNKPVLPVGYFQGMTFAARFNKKGNKVLISESKNGDTDIYEVDLDRKSTQQITDLSAISTSPIYSPINEAEILFNSDAGGKPAIFKMNLDGSNRKCLSSGEGRYFTPVYSPNGKYIAFTKQLSGSFYIGIMESDGSNEKILVSAENRGVIESPSWAPNSKLLIFASSPPGNANSSLYIVDISGKFHKRLPTPYGGSEPNWFPNPYLTTG